MSSLFLYKIFFWCMFAGFWSLFTFGLIAFYKPINRKGYSGLTLTLKIKISGFIEWLSDNLVRKKSK